MTSIIIHNMNEFLSLFMKLCCLCIMISGTRWWWCHHHLIGKLLFSWIFTSNVYVSIISFTTNLPSVVVLPCAICNKLIILYTYLWHIAFIFTLKWKLLRPWTDFKGQGIVAIKMSITVSSYLWNISVDQAWIAPSQFYQNFQESSFSVNTNNWSSTLMFSFFFNITSYNYNTMLTEAKKECIYK